MAGKGLDSGWRGAGKQPGDCGALRLIQHTKDLMESEEKLCVKVLRTLQQMLLKKSKYGDRVSAWGMDRWWMGLQTG